MDSSVTDIKSVESTAPVSDMASELAHVNREMYKKNLELAQKNKTLSLLRQIDSIILNTVTDIKQISQNVADVVVENTEYVKAVVILLLNKHEKALVRIALSKTEAVKKAEHEFNVTFVGLKTPLSDLNNIVVKAVNQRRVNATHNLFDVLTPHFREEEAKKIQSIVGNTSSYVYPLIARGDVIGAMIISIDEKDRPLSYFQIDLIDRLPGIVAIALDNALLYKELQEANAKLKQLDKLKDEFVSLASHELRTPMTIIKSYLWMILDKERSSLNQKQKLYLDRAYASTERLIDLVNDMLNVSRIESGRLTLDIKPIDLVQLADTVYQEMLPKAQELGIKLELKKPKDSFPKVQADKERIEQVFINLIGNSLKFTPRDGKITITLSYKDNMVTIEISDTGKGISKEDIPKLFQKFGMVGNKYLQKSNAQGTGLGLYICKGIVELHGGKIWAESQGIGKGAAFSFTLKTAEENR